MSLTLSDLFRHNPSPFQLLPQCPGPASCLSRTEPKMSHTSQRSRRVPERVTQQSHQVEEETSKSAAPVAVLPPGAGGFERTGREVELE